MLTRASAMGIKTRVSGLLWSERFLFETVFHLLPLLYTGDHESANHVGKDQPW